MATGWTGTPGLNAPSLNCMRARRFVFVPSGQRNNCGRLSSPESARALIRSLASCRDSAVRLKKSSEKGQRNFAWILRFASSGVFLKLGFSRVVKRICSCSCSRCILAEYGLALDKYEGYLASKFP